jgi:hypothetical protein
MTRQDRLRKEARHRHLQDGSIIDHLARNFGSGGAGGPGRRIDGDAGLCEQFRKRWIGGLPEF